MTFTLKNKQSITSRIRQLFCQEESDEQQQQQQQQQRTMIRNKEPTVKDGQALSQSLTSTTKTTCADASLYDDVAALFPQRAASSWCERDEARILQPYKYLRDNPGQNFRSLLIKTINVWLKCPAEKVTMIDEAITMAHTSSLMIDDIEDGSELRRGQPSSHIVHGTPLTINSANYVYFQLFAHVRKMTDRPLSGHRPLQSSDEVQQMLLEEMLNLHRGQGMDLYWRDNFVCPTEREYVAMVNNKTSGLFRILLKLMISQSTALQSVKEGLEIETFFNLTGLLFQIRDDYLNLRSGDYTQNKGYCEDLTEGKFSFPIIHALSISKAKIARPDNDLGRADVVARIPQGEATELRFSTDDGMAKVSQTFPGHVQRFEAIRRHRASLSSPFHDTLDSNSVASERMSIDKGSLFQRPTDTPNTDGCVAERPSIKSHEELVHALRARPTDADRKCEIVAFMQDTTGSFRYTCDVMLRLDKQIRQELHRLEKTFDDGRPNEGLRGFVDKLRKGWYMSNDCPAAL